MKDGDGEKVVLDHEGTIRMINTNYKDYFKNKIVEKGFKKGFKGNWGASAHTKRLGIIQDLNRLSFNSYISQLRKINLPLDASAKVIGPLLIGLGQPIEIAPLRSSTSDILNLASVAAYSAGVINYNKKN